MTINRIPTDMIIDRASGQKLSTQLADMAKYDALSSETVSGSSIVVEKKYPYGDVRRYGAKGDGVTDDTVAFQKAFDFSNTTGYAVLIKDGTFKLTSSVTLKNNGVYTVEGNSKATIKPSSDLFVGELISTSVTNITINIEKVFVDYGLTINTFCIFKGIQLLSCRIERNKFQYMGTFLDGYMNYDTRITRNIFFGISKYFIDTSRYASVSLSDGYITDNYISGRSSQNPSCFNVYRFDGGFNVSGNWIELFKYVFTYSTTGQREGCIFHNNIVNHCYRLLEPTMTYTKFMFTNNSFQVMSYSQNTSNFPNMTSDMTTGKWGVFVFDSNDTGAIYDTVITNNHLDVVDYYIYINSTFTNQKGCYIQEKNTLGKPTNANFYTTRNAGDKSGFLNTYIESLDNQDKATLPTAVDTGNNAVIVFNNQRIWVNGILYVARVVNSTITLVQLN